MGIMKKSVFAGVLGLALVLGVGVTGAAWYTGKRAESYLGQTLGQINGALQALREWDGDAVPVIDLMELERGVFSTTRRYRLTLTPAKGVTGAAPQEIRFIETLDHGPFPLQRLKAGRYAPAMVAGRIQLEDTATVKDWFAKAEGKVPVSGEYTIDYSKQYSARVDVRAMVLQHDSVMLRVWNMTGDVAYSADRQRGVVQWQADKLSVLSQGKRHAGIELVAPSWRYELSRTPDGARATQQKLAFKTGTLVARNRPFWILEDTSLAFGTTQAGRLWGAEAGIDIGAFRGWGKGFGTGLGLGLNPGINPGLNPDADAGSDTDLEHVSLQLAAAVKNWDLNAARALVGTSAALANRDYPTEYGADAQQLMASMALHLQQFLVGGPTLASSLTVRTASGISAMKLDLGLIAPDPTQSPLQSPLHGMLKKLDFNMALSKQLLRDVIVMRQGAPGVAVARAAQRMAAARQAEAIAAALADRGLASIDGDALLARVRIADYGLVESNGAFMPFDTFLGHVSGMMRRLD
jgi:uncharacterized protein YdgA (DUF945 family)